MATFVVTHEFANYLGQGDVELDAHTFKAVITNTTPVQATDTNLAGLTQIAATGGYAAVTLTSVTFTETGSGTGIWEFDSAPFAWTASGANFATGQYIYIYDDTHASAVIVGYLNYGSTFVVTDGNTLTVTPGASGIMRITVS
jgi:hypothetical protein